MFRNTWVGHTPFSIFKSVVIYPFFLGKIKEFGNLSGVKDLTNYTSSPQMAKSLSGRHEPKLDLIFFTNPSQDFLLLTCLTVLLILVCRAWAMTCQTWVCRAGKASLQVMSCRDPGICSIGLYLFIRSLIKTSYLHKL